jgi:hypothetical protein
LAAYTQILGPYGGDYRVVWTAGRDLLRGIDPYAIAADGTVPALAQRFFYPLPAAAFGMPFAWLSPPLAAICFASSSAVFLMFAVTREHLNQVPFVLGIPFIFACKISQTTPLVMALALTPGLAGVSLLKPNLGAAFFARSPRVAPLVVCGALLLVGFAVFPAWPSHWLTTVRSSTVHGAPFRTSLGAVGLLSILRWRRPEARLLFMMTVIPHGLEFYDEIPLWLVATTRREAMLLTFASWVGCLAWLGFGDGAFMHSPPWSTAFLYVPAAALVLRRENVGELPGWLESRVRALPSFLRGSTVAQRAADPSPVQS